MQVYRDLRIVTARPSEDEEAQAPHRLFGYIDGAEACSAARWADDAKLAISSAHADGRLPIIVGGTGLYIRTLLDGIAPVPPIDPMVRAEVRALTVGDMYLALRQEDAAAADRLAAADSTRVARALEVVRSTGVPLKAWQSERAGGIGNAIRLAPMILLPPRPWLFERCDARFGEIFEHGQKEVAALVARGLDAALPVMRAIGVAEIAAFQAGRLSRIEAMTAGSLATRQYAKRQFTWFRRQMPESWSRSPDTLDVNKVHEFAIMLRDMALTP